MMFIISKRIEYRIPVGPLAQTAAAGTDHVGEWKWAKRGNGCKTVTATGVYPSAFERGSAIISAVRQASAVSPPKPPTLPTPCCRLYLPVGVPHADRPAAQRDSKPQSTFAGRSSLGDQGWQRFSGEYGSDIDTLNGALHARTRRGPTPPTLAVPPSVLWDKSERTIVNNESADILQILNRDFGAVAAQAIDLRPAGLEAEIVRTNERLYADFNNGVYQAGFAGTQNAS